MSTVPVHDGLFETAADGTLTLVGGRCAACDRPHFPRLTTCPWCGDEGVEPTRLSREGALWGWTLVTTAPPGYEGPVPFGFGVIELPEGLRVITRLAITDPAAHTFGEAMRLVADRLTTDAEGDDVITWAFAPVGGGGDAGGPDGGDGPGEGDGGEGTPP